MNTKSLLFFCFCCCWFFTQAQVITTDKAFPTADQPLSITFDAREGNKGLENCNCDVYLHTGVITTESTSVSDWKYVQGEWGVEIPRLKMTRTGLNKYTYELTVRDFYGLPEGEKALQLAFVFRNADGSMAGRATDGGDIFLDLFDQDAGLNSVLINPAQDLLFIRSGESIDIEAQVSESALLRLEEGGEVIFAMDQPGTELMYQYTPDRAPGKYQVDLIADAESGISDTTSFTYFILSDNNVAELPALAKPGLNRNADGSATFVLEAPDKEFAFLLMEANDFGPATDFLLNKTPDGSAFWLTVDGLGDDPAAWHSYQYLVDGELYIADPYSELILDPRDDRFIDFSDWPTPLPAYPDQAVGNVSIFKMEGFPYEWQENDFAPPAVEDLVIYELLMRDFLATHHYRELTDTLDYLQKLGVNAIELMPVNEFEGNDSWGYNPSFHMALDKYYGDPVSFKRFVDAAHERGIAVILDVVYNHAFSQSPLAQLYWDPAGFQPAADNPWLNVTARHPFNVGYDFDHESELTRRFVDQVMTYWLEEFRLDGFRFDLSKGFTQVNSGDDVGLWGRYDAGRIAILNHYAGTVRSVNPEAYVILEHFAEDDEERELAGNGMLFWNKMTDPYNEATLGFESNFNRASYQDRGWPEPNLINYMESHDEERLMYKNLQFGASEGDYNIKDVGTGLDRVELATVFFYTIPGPKMLWQFGELGYDFSINYCRSGVVDGCRLDPKPIRWDYLTDRGRQDLWSVTSNMIDLKKRYDVFRTTDFTLDTEESLKTIHLNHEEFDVAVLGNFGLSTQEIDPDFQSTGLWYEFFSGESLNVSNPNALISLAPGEYRLYTSQDIGQFVTNTEELPAIVESFTAWPNPARGQINLELTLKQATEVTLFMVDAQGRVVRNDDLGRLVTGRHQVNLETPSAAGAYYVVVRLGSGQSIYRPIVVEGQ